MGRGELQTGAEMAPDVAMAASRLTGMAFQKNVRVFLCEFMVGR